MPIRRVTEPTLHVLSALLAQPAHQWYGLELCKKTGLPSGTLYPILAKLELEGWLDSRWEEPQRQEEERRPRRRYYWLNGTGRIEAGELISGRERSALKLKVQQGLA